MLTNNDERLPKNGYKPLKKEEEFKILMEKADQFLQEDEEERANHEDDFVIIEVKKVKPVIFSMPTMVCGVAIEPYFFCPKPGRKGNGH